jgi:hypothetical protein
VLGAIAQKPVAECFGGQYRSMHILCEISVTRITLVDKFSPRTERDGSATGVQAGGIPRLLPHKVPGNQENMALWLPDCWALLLTS